MRILAFLVLGFAAAVASATVAQAGTYDLTIGDEADVAKADKLLHKAERSCLITNSLIAPSRLSTEVRLA